MGDGEALLIDCSHSSFLFLITLIDIGVPVNTKIMSPVDGQIIEVIDKDERADKYITLRFYDDNNVSYDIIFMHLNVKAKFDSV